MILPPSSFADRLNNQNQLPAFDGEITPWASPFAQASSGYQNRIVLYCNGVGTPATGHRMECMEVSTACECLVYGVYNQSGISNFPGKEYAIDRLVAAAEQLGPAMGMLVEAMGIGMPASTFSQVGQTIGTAVGTSLAIVPVIRWFIDGLWQSTQDIQVNAIQAIGAKLWSIPGFTAEHRRIVVRNLLYYNHAALSYFDLLDSRWNQQPILAIGYSQGNWILSNALSGLRAVRRGANLLPPTVHAFGLAPPNFFWPQGISLHLYANTNDLIPLLSLGAGQTGDTPTWGNGSFDVAYWHSQEQYVQQSQFVQDLRSLLGLNAIVNFPTPIDEGAQNVRDPNALPRPTTNVTRNVIVNNNAAPNVGSIGSYGGRVVDPRTLAPKPGKPTPRRQ